MAISPPLWLDCAYEIGKVRATLNQPVFSQQQKEKQD
jgi:hypothetical protein